MSKRVLALALVFVFVFVILSTSVSAQSTDEDGLGLRPAVGSSNLWEDVKGWSSSVFDSWATGGEANPTILKALFFIMITLLIFSILDVIGLFGNKPALFVISVVVGLLSTFLLESTEIINIARIYESLGGTLLVLVPFLIIGAFSMRAIMDGNVQLMITQQIAWVLFALFQLYNLFVTGHNFLLWVIFIITLVLAVPQSNGWLMDFFGERVLRAKAVRSASSMHDIRTGIDLFRNTGEQAAGR